MGECGKEKQAKKEKRKKGLQNIKSAMRVRVPFALKTGAL